MQKTIIKSALITLAGIILALGLVFGGFAIFNPTSLGDFFSQMGMENCALGCYENAYKKDESTQNLTRLLNSAIISENGEVLSEYFVYLEEQSTAVSDNYFLTVAGEYYEELIKQGKEDDAVNKAYDHAVSYLRVYPLQALTAYGITNEDKELCEKVLSALNSFSSQTAPNLSAEEQSALQSTLNALQTYLN